MRSTPALEGRIVIVQDEKERIPTLELALSRAGATIFFTLAVRETVDLMLSLKPFAVMMDPTPDTVGAVFLWRRRRSRRP